MHKYHHLGVIRGKLSKECRKWVEFVIWSMFSWSSPTVHCFSIFQLGSSLFSTLTHHDSIVSPFPNTKTLIRKNIKIHWFQSHLLRPFLNILFQPARLPQLPNKNVSPPYQVPLLLITFTLTFTSLPPPAFPPLFIIIFSLLLPLIHLTRGYHKIRRKYESCDETSILHLFFHPGQPGDQAKEQLCHLEWWQWWCWWWWFLILTESHSLTCRRNLSTSVSGAQQDSWWWSLIILTVVTTAMMFTLMTMKLFVVVEKDGDDDNMSRFNKIHSQRRSSRTDRWVPSKHGLVIHILTVTVFTNTCTI